MKHWSIIQKLNLIRKSAIYRQLRLYLAKRFGGDQVTEVDSGHPIFFRVLRVDKANRRIQFETLYWPLVQDRLQDFGVISDKYEHERLGYDSTDGSLRHYIYSSGTLNVAPIYDFQRAVDRAAGLSSMTMDDIRHIAWKSSVENAQAQAQQQAAEKQEAPRGINLVSLKSIEQMRQIIIETSSPDFINATREIGVVVYSGAVTDDGHIWRYIIDVPYAVDFNYAIYVCATAAEKFATETVQIGEVWDIWKTGE